MFGVLLGAPENIGCCQLVLVTWYLFASLLKPYMLLVHFPSTTFIHLAIAKVVSVLAASYLSSLLRLLQQIVEV